jgi:ribosomal-protein-alanine N-acetyltransferase
MYARLGLERPPSGAELGRHFERSAPELAAGRSISLTVTEPGSDAAVGGIDVHSLDWSDARAELALWLAPQVRGRGYAARALRLAAGWLFSACGLQRVQFMTETDNEAMLAAGRAAGFHYEGVLRGYAREPGARRDLAVMSLLPADLSG